MKLHWIDMVIVILSLIAAVGVGVWFSRKQNSTKAYFAANGSVPAWAVGMSMFATIISSVTFLAYPGAAYYIIAFTGYQVSGKTTGTSYDQLRTELMNKYQPYINVYPEIFFMKK